MVILGSGRLAGLEVQVDANTVTAICGVAIAVVSLAVSAYVAWATRKHNRLSVLPVLEFTTTFPVGGTAGLRLTNSGLGPARVSCRSALPIYTGGLKRRTEGAA